MGYIGREPTNSGQFLLIDDISGEFNGSKSSFTLKIGGIEITPAASNTIIALDGVLQEANDAYSISGSTIAFTGAPGSEFTFYGVLAGQSQYISNNSITDEHISPTADISGSKINTNFSGQTVTAKDFGGNISGSISSTGSFGRLEIAGNTNLTGDIEFDDVTATGNIITTGTNKVISGSITSTGSFGRVNSTTIDIDSIQGNWTNAGNTVADLGVITTVDINGGTIDGITSLTAGGDLDIGAHDLRAATLTADSLTATRVPFAGTDGVLSDDSDLTFATATLSATNLTSTGTIKDFASVSGSFVSTGSVGRIQTRTADIGIVTGTSLTTTGNISGSTTSTGSFGRLQTQQANALIGGNVVTLGGNLTTQNNNVTINAAGAARTLTLNESLTIGDGHDGTITFGAASKTLTVENTSLLNQDLTTDASPTFAGATITGTLTVQEVHTEFESASILFTSGSTKFGNSTDDVHNVTGSMKITGSFQVDNGTLTAGTVDINGGTVDGITSLTAGGDLDIGSHGFRAATLTADGLTATRVPFAGSNGLLSDDSDLTFATATLSATNLTSTGTIKNFGLVSGSFVSTGSVGRIQTRTADVGIITGTSLTTTGNISGSVTSTGSFGGVFSAGVSRFDGDVGIGVSSPGGNLVVSSSTKTDLLVGDNSSVFSDTGRGNIEINGYGTATLGMTIDGAAKGLLFHDGTDSYFRNYANGQFQVFTNNTVRMTVSSSGEVGIGETAPIATLHIKEGDSGLTSLNSSGTNLFLEANGANAAGMTLASGTGANGFIIFADSDSNFRGAIQYDHSSPDKMHLTTSGSQRVTIDQHGNVGIGATAPSMKLQIQESTHGANVGIRLYAENDGGTAQDGHIIFDPDAVFFGLSKGGTTINLGVDSAGRVGIGTDSPSELLTLAHAAGDGDGGILIINEATTVADDVFLGGIGFDSADGNIPSSVGEAGAAMVARSAEAQSAGDKGADLLFLTTAIDDDDDTGSHERMRITSEGAIGIGTNSPLTALHVKGATGNPASSGTTPTAIARFDSNFNSVLDIGQGADPYAMWLQSHDRSNLSQYYKLSLNPDGGDVGIGTINPAQRLEVASAGNAYIAVNANRAGAGTDNAGVLLQEAGNDLWTIRNEGNSSNRLAILDEGFDDGVQLAQNGSGFSDISDERAKTDLVTIADAVDKVNSLRAVNFKWKYGSEERRTKNNIGIIAQDVYKVLPEAVTIPEEDYKVVDHPKFEGEKQAQNLWTVDKGKLTVLLIKAVQELSEKIEHIEKTCKCMKEG